MIIDLDIIQEKTVEAKVKGETIHLKEASQKLVLQMIALQELEKKNPSQQMNELVNVVSTILSNNVENKKYSPDYVAEILNPKHCLVLLEAYFKWTTELQANPT